MDKRTAGINHIGDIPLPLFLMRDQKRFVQASDYFCRVFQVKHQCAYAILAHWPDTVGEYDPALIGFQR